MNSYMHAIKNSISSMHIHKNMHMHMHMQSHIHVLSVKMPHRRALPIYCIRASVKLLTGQKCQCLDKHHHHSSTDKLRPHPTTDRCTQEVTGVACLPSRPSA